MEKEKRPRYFQYIASAFKLKNYLTYFILGALMITAIVLSRTKHLNYTYTGLMCQLSYYIILAVSLNLVVGFLGELSLGHAGFMCVGAYIGCFCGNLMDKFIPNQYVVIVLSMIIGGLAATAFGFVIGLPALRLKGDYLAICTLAFGEIVRNVFGNWDLFGGASGLMVTALIKEKNLMIVGFIAVMISLILIKNLIRSKHGRAITAIRDNEIAARAMGIRVVYYKLFVFMFAAFFAGMAGVLYGWQNGSFRQENFDYNYSIEILVMVVLGGMGNIDGSIIAAALLTWINVVLQARLSSMGALKLIVYAAILIVVVIYNNAPALKGVREKFNIRNLLHKTKNKTGGAAEQHTEDKLSMNEGADAAGNSFTENKKEDV